MHEYQQVVSQILGMATEINDATIACTFQWKIVNLSRCCLRKGEFMSCPVFTGDALKGTRWMLFFYVKGLNDENKLDFNLYRTYDDTEIEVVQVSYQLSFVDKSGSILQEINGLPNQSFAVDSECGFERSLSRDFIFGRGKEAYLPDDTLTVRCTLWETETKPDAFDYLYGRTVFQLNRRSFMWRLEKFTTLKSGQKYNFSTESFDLDFFITEELDCERKLGLKCNELYSLEYFCIKTSVVDSAGRKKNCGTHEYFEKDLEVGLSYTLFSSKDLTENKYVLTLEGAYSFGTYDHEFCGFLNESPESTNESVESLSGLNIKKGESKSISDLAEDFKSIYNDGDFSDIEIRTSTKSFPAHKIVLSARSPVFRSMLSNDMKERDSGHVDITDFEDDTVHRMLLYMYTDSLEDLHFESASSLYKIADKYQILSLKRSCFLFLKENLSPSNACDVLVLADLLSDGDLKSAAQDFVLGQKKQFFSSEEWKKFMKTHHDIAADVMCMKICRE